MSSRSAVPKLEKPYVVLRKQHARMLKREAMKDYGYRLKWQSRHPQTACTQPPLQSRRIRNAAHDRQ